MRNFIVYKLGRFIPDRVWIQLKFFLNFGRFCNLKNPQTYNEKLQWLKLYDRRPEYTRMVDKYEAKKYVADIIGEQYIIPTLGVWDKFEDIDFESLPNQFVLKTTHDCGGVVICKDKKNLDIDKTRDFINKHLQSDYYLTQREWPYKNVKPRIFAEQFMVDESGYELKDYKWFCFGGEPKALFIASDRGVEGEETKFNFYDRDFNLLPFTNGHSNSTKPIYRPKGFECMKELAAKLSEGIPQLRVDFYDINGQIYFGELTFFHWSGLVPFQPQEWDNTFGSWIKLPVKNEE